MTSFDPTQHGFKKLDHEFEGGLALYELILDGIDQSAHDQMRINVYLTQDGEYVTIWSGLIDSYMIELNLRAYVPDDFSFKEQYDRDLFRGYIEDDEAGAIILKALRVEKQSPNVLTISDEGKLECHALRSA